MPEIRVTKDGPYLVSGELPLAKATIATNAEGESIRWEWGKPFPAKTNVALCSCGGSASKPYCDGTHSRIGFDGTETASRERYREQAKLIEGPVLSLTDAEGLCAFARFCDPNGQVWRLLEETDRTKAREDFVRQTCDCPSGRLVAWNNETGEPIEPKLPQSIGLVEDPVEDCSGPLWVRGGVAPWSPKTAIATRCATASRSAAAAPPRTSRSAMVLTPRSSSRTGSNQPRSRGGHEDGEPKFLVR